MNLLVDEIAELEACRTDAERARWLLTCSHGHLGRYEMTIRNRLMSAGFLAGLAYLDAERAAKFMRREPDGTLPQAAANSLVSARVRMMLIAEGGP